jgi:uncharacterized phage-associated protein
MINERKITHAAAYLLKKAPARHLTTLKLLKLLYLSDRMSLQQYGHFISDDHFVSMERGPVLSHTYNLIKDPSSYSTGLWLEFMSATSKVTLKQEAVNRKLGALSVTDEEIFDLIWNTFGSMSAQELSDWTHENCSEWKDPGQSSTPITYFNVAKAVGFNNVVAKEMVAHIEAQQEVTRLFDQS